MQHDADTKSEVVRNYGHDALSLITKMVKDDALHKVGTLHIKWHHQELFHEWKALLCHLFEDVADYRITKIAQVDDYEAGFLYWTFVCEPWQLESQKTKGV